MNRKNIEEYDFIRVIATLFVVIGHTGYLSMETKYGGITLNIDEVALNQKIIDFIIRFIYSFHMPLFFALSGSIFKLSLSNGKINSIKQIVKSKTRRLIIPFYIVTLFYVVPIKYFIGYFDMSQNKIYDIILGQFFLCGNTHLWFLIVLFQVIIVAYYIEKLKLCWLKILLIVFLFYLGNFIKIEFLGISKVFTNIVWFYTGVFYQSRYLYFRKNIKKYKSMYLKIAILLEVTVMCFYLSFFKNNIYFYAIINFSGIFLSLIISYFCINFKVINSKLYKIILKNSFIIYLFSDTINYVILYFIKKYNYEEVLTTNIGCVLLFIIRILISLFLPLIMVYILKKIKKFVFKKEKYE